MLQAFTPVIAMACAFVAGLEVPHFKLVLSVLVIAGGVAAASFGAVDFSVMGIFIMFLSELTESIRLIMTQMLLQGYKFNASTCTHDQSQHFHCHHSRGPNVHGTGLRLLAVHRLDGL